MKTNYAKNYSLKLMLHIYSHREKEQGRFIQKPSRQENNQTFEWDGVHIKLHAIYKKRNTYIYMGLWACTKEKESRAEGKTITKMLGDMLMEYIMHGCMINISTYHNCQSSSPQHSSDHLKMHGQNLLPQTQLAP